LGDSTVAVTTGGIRNETAQGISLLNSAANNLGAIAISVNALGRRDLTVSWTAEDLTTTAGRTNSLVLQYRVGSSGPWTSVNGSTYTSDGAGKGASTTFTGIALPAAVNRQSLVQLRWLYFLVQGTGARDRIRLDDITIRSSLDPTPPTLTAAVGATVDAPFVITYPTHPAWRGAITSISVGGVVLSAGFNAATNGQITLTPSGSTLLQTAGPKTITVKATGYEDATVVQTIGVGAPAKLAVTTQPTAPAVNGQALA
jgi:hypothetical protein